MRFKMSWEKDFCFTDFSKNILRFDGQFFFFENMKLIFWVFFSACFLNVKKPPKDFSTSRYP